MTAGEFPAVLRIPPRPLRNSLSFATRAPGKNRGDALRNYPPFHNTPLVLKSQISNPLSATRKNACSILVTSAHTPVKLSKTMPDSRRPELKQLYTIPSVRQVPARGGRTAILPTAVRTTPWSRRVVYGFLKSGRNRFRQPNLDPPRGDQIRTRIDPPSPRSAVESR